ncbi:MAG: CHASE3 domain-containing protein [Bdellovibrionales bacterium]|nr:CHASE3 domain-containing protein [Bdellovibrionales bacterium]
MRLTRLLFPFARLDRTSLRIISWTATFVLVVVCGLAVWSVRTYQESSKWGKHSGEVLIQMSEVILATEAADSAQRGFLITSQELFLSQYREAKTLATNGLEKLRSMISDNSDQRVRVNKISEVMSRRLAFMDSMVALKLSGHGAMAVTEIKAGRGQSLKNQLRNEFLEMRDHEMALLNERITKAEADFNRSAQFVVFALLFSFFLKFFVIQALHVQIKNRLAAEVQLEHAKAKALEASHSKSRFLANMSHEIRTPLNAVIGMSKLLMQTELSPRQGGFVDIIQTSSNSLLSLINDILDLSKVESGKMLLEHAHFELDSFLKRTLAIVDFAAKSKGLGLRIRIAEDLPEFYLGDPLRLRQVLLNLLNNAIKFSERGEIILNVSKVKEDDASVSLLFEVIDQGIGIEPGKIPKLFQVFSQGDETTTRKFGGSGLGLAISKQIVEMMGGQIGVESVNGAGSRFFFEISLRVARFAIADSAESKDRMEPKSLNARVLVVEDNQANQLVVAEMLNLMGCDSLVVPNGAEALDVLSRENFDLILMDGQMPVMDGYETTRRIREIQRPGFNRFIPIIATTANPIRGDIEKCLEAGMSDYVGKPISYDDLSQKVEKWVRFGPSSIDPTAIAKMQALGLKSSRNLLSDLISVFDRETPNLLVDLKKHLASGEFEAMGKIAHQLKSSCANLGVIRLRELAIRMEDAVPEKNIQVMELLLSSMENDFAHASEELKKYRAA